jgi:hypothetical protein
LVWFGAVVRIGTKGVAVWSQDWYLVILELLLLLWVCWEVVFVSGTDWRWSVGLGVVGVMVSLWIEGVVLPGTGRGSVRVQFLVALVVAVGALDVLDGEL